MCQDPEPEANAPAAAGRADTDSGDSAYGLDMLVQTFLRRFTPVISLSCDPEFGSNSVHL